MNFNHDLGLIDTLQTIDVTALPPLGGTAGVLSIVGTGALVLPAGLISERPTGVAAMLRYQTDGNVLEYYNGAAWSVLSVGGGTVTSVAASSASAGLTVGGSPVTSSGTLTFTLSNELEALSELTTTGLVARTGTATYSPVTITGTAGNVSVTNGDGVAGAPTINLVDAGTPVSASFVKITTDAKGRVTATTAVTTSDITALADGTYVNVAGDTMSSGANLTFVGGGEVLGLPATPSAASAAASKAYVDAVAAGLSWKNSVKAATLADVDLTTGGLLIVDGYQTLDGDRVLVMSQTDLTQNGIYVAHAGAWVRSTDMDDTTPINEVNGAAVYVELGTTFKTTGWTQIDQVATLGTDNVEWTQFSGVGSYTAGTGLTLTGTVFSLTTPVTTSLGGTGLTSIGTASQILGVNTAGTGLEYKTVAAGTGVSVTPTAGTLTIANTGVLSLTGTANQVAVSASTGAVTVSLPSNVTVTSSLTVSGLTPNAFLYSGTAGLLTSTAAPTNGQLLIGSTGSAPVAAALTAGTGISVTNAAGSITIANTGVTSVAVSGGTTGLTTSGGPITTTGTITLAGTLNVANGGTGLTALGSANQVLGVNAAGTTAEYKTIAAGTGVSVVHTANTETVNNTGVTSVALTAPSIFTVSGSPVTTTGTLDFALNTQAANTVFAGPTTGADAVPTFRALGYADLPIQLYVENPSTPTAPVATGANAVAIGSGSAASAAGSFAVGDGSLARLAGQKAFANGSFANAGDAQHGVYVLRNTTTNATTTPLFLDGSAAQLVVPNNSVVTFSIIVAARRTDATGGGAGYKFDGVVRKDATAGSVTIIGAVSKTVLGETNGPWDATFAVDTGTGALVVSGKGEAAKNVSWVATVLTTEVTN